VTVRTQHTGRLKPVIQRLRPLSHRGVVHTKLPLSKEHPKVMNKLESKEQEVLHPSDQTESRERCLRAVARKNQAATVVRAAHRGSAIRGLTYPTLLSL
jgi:hypothetical protein